MRNDKNCILIADDEKEIRDILSLLLSSEGYEVIVTANGSEAVNRASEEVDLYILDVNMPEMSGFVAGSETFFQHGALNAYQGHSSSAGSKRAICPRAFVFQSACHPGLDFGSGPANHTPWQRTDCSDLYRIQNTGTACFKPQKNFLSGSHLQYGLERRSSQRQRHYGTY